MIVPFGCLRIVFAFSGALGPVCRSGLFGCVGSVSSAFWHAVVSLFGGWKIACNFQIASLVGIPCSMNGCFGWGFFKIWIIWLLLPVDLRMRFLAFGRILGRIQILLHFVFLRFLVYILLTFSNGSLLCWWSIQFCRVLPYFLYVPVIHVLWLCILVGQEVFLFLKFGCMQIFLDWCVMAVACLTWLLLF